ncbi:hypothetical protein [Heterosigma akashiwo virus 01]|jgi:hypothetical protein|uniref:Uncharacterized protein n=1 Tax=Heterosigma akashiwo virus 01 TaxID=97195 RepID=A0A1C9C5J1_HAV01|nr:hypothetical protein D1R72_gp219 [Heterosigma akashiwo virus 01]AOM63550.1 hypothetical protein [Heterosigma akashiwo virus 01]
MGNVIVSIACTLANSLTSGMFGFVEKMMMRFLNNILKKFLKIITEIMNKIIAIILDLVNQFIDIMKDAFSKFIEIILEGMKKAKESGKKITGAIKKIGFFTNEYEYFKIDIDTNERFKVENIENDLPDEIEIDNSELIEKALKVKEEALHKMNIAIQNSMKMIEDIKHEIRKIANVR